MALNLKVGDQLGCFIPEGIPDAIKEGRAKIRWVIKSIDENANPVTVTYDTFLGDVNYGTDEVALKDAFEEKYYYIIEP